jgi:hypothetical protein
MLSERLESIHDRKLEISALRQAVVCGAADGAADPRLARRAEVGVVRYCGMTTARYGAVGFSLAPVMAGT